MIVEDDSHDSGSLCSSRKENSKEIKPNRTNETDHDKPIETTEDRLDAQELLRQLLGCSHSRISGVCLIEGFQGRAGAGQAIVIQW